MSQQWKKIPHGSKLPVYFSEEEVRLIREHTFVDPDFGRSAIVEGGRLKLELSLDDIEEVQGFVAAEANHTSSKKLERQLDKLYDKLQTLLDQYDDRED